MDDPMLATKLHPPSRRAGAVVRSRLTERLRDPARLALSGMWMGAFSALPEGDGVALMVLRLGFGGYMLLGPAHETGRAIAMGLAWLTNLLVAELAVRRRATAASVGDADYRRRHVPQHPLPSQLRAADDR